jgi:L-lysine 2,3-aminomutase
MSIRKNLEDWQKESNKIHNNEFDILEDPKNGETKVNILHKKCGNTLTITLRNHVNRYCKYCSKKNIKSLEEFQSESDKIHNSEFRILETPKNGKINVL